MNRNIKMLLFLIVLISSLISAFSFRYKNTTTYAVVPEVTPTVTATPTPTPTPLSEEQLIINEIMRVFGEHGEEAVKVARCESHFNPEAKNASSSATGIFQILAYTHGVKEKWLTNYVVNIQIAKQLYDERGWSAWVSSAGCHGVY